MNKPLLCLLLVGWLSLCSTTKTIPHTINLASLASDVGITISGPTVGAFGYKAVYIGDFNQDGIQDILATAPSTGTSAEGAAYVIFGTKTPSKIDMSNFDITQGIKITSTVAYGMLGTSAGGAGDFNNDGIPDVIIGASSYNKAGAAWILFGTKTPSDVDLDNLNPAQGIKLTGPVDYSGFAAAVIGVGDFNDDKIDDVAIGAVNVDNFGGATYVIFGSKIPSDILSNNLAPNQGITIKGKAAEGLGSSISGIRDINGDGIRDLIIGAPAADTRAGAVYLIYGQKTTSDIMLNSLTSAQGFGIKANNPVQGALFGYSVGAGYINGDAIQDIVVGEPGANLETGKVHIIFGTGTTITSSTAITTNNGGFQVKYTSTDTPAAGFALCVGDVNGDWYDDILIGAPKENSNTGSGYVVFGSSSLTPTDIDLSTLTPAEGIKIIGANPGDLTGLTIGVGRFTEDNSISVMIANPAANNNNGELKIIFGIPNTTPPPPGRKAENQFGPDPKVEPQSTPNREGVTPSPEKSVNNESESVEEKENSWFEDHKPLAIALCTAAPVLTASGSAMLFMLIKRRLLRQRQKVVPQNAKLDKVTNRAPSKTESKPTQFDVTVQDADASSVPTLNKKHLSIPRKTRVGV